MRMIVTAAPRQVKRHSLFGVPRSRGSNSSEHTAEVEMSRTESGNIGRLNEIGELVPLTCSECGGPLWQIKDERMTRFRCRVGHAYTAQALAAEIGDAVERSLWVAVQMMDERTRTLEHLAATEQEKDHRRGPAHFATRPTRPANTPSVYGNCS